MIGARLVFEGRGVVEEHRKRATWPCRGTFVYVCAMRMAMWPHVRLASEIKVFLLVGNVKA